jgi:hypothetical protein
MANTMSSFPHPNNKYQKSYRPFYSVRDLLIYRTSCNYTRSETKLAGFILQKGQNQLNLIVVS